MVCSRADIVNLTHIIITDTKYIILKCVVINTLIVTQQQVSRRGTNCRGVKMISEHIINITHLLLNYTQVT